MRGLYLHIPLCRSKCTYCDFYSLPANKRLGQGFVDALQIEISLKGQLWGGPVDTVYFGGGTPSCLTLEQAAAILRECGRFFSWDVDSEVTFEVNPGTVDKGYLMGLRELGVNRLSLGLQAAQDHHLLRLGRAHDMQDFERVVADIHAAGFQNFSVDAIYGLPNQSLAEYLETLQRMADTGAKHVSVYSLQLEPGTILHRQWEEGQIEVPHEDEVADMMEQGKRYLESRGFIHYEISNFAQPGFKSIHNTLYWQNKEYVGLGPGATSYLLGRRFTGTADLNAYSELLRIGLLPVGSCEMVDKAQSMAETVILALRMLDEGVSRSSFIRRFGCDPVDVWPTVVDRFVVLGLLEVTADAIRLTGKGFPIASQVQLAFLP